MNKILKIDKPRATLEFEFYKDGLTIDVEDKFTGEGQYIDLTLEEIEKLKEFLNKL